MQKEGKRMIYLDNSASTKPFPEVIESFVKVSSDYFGNPSSLHGIGGQAENLLTQARTQTAKLLSVKPNEIYFTSGGTEGNNLAIKGTAYNHKRKDYHLITTSIEHASVKECFKELEQNGFSVTYLPVDSNGRVDLDVLQGAIQANTILVSVMHVNNEVGTIQPIQEIGMLLKKHPNILFHVDYVQGIGKVPLRLYEYGIDLCTISAHKFHGLKGTGLLFVRDGVRLHPILSGGNQERKLRSGTENVAGFVSMAKAMRMIMEKQEKELAQLWKVSKLLRNGLKEVEGVSLNTPESNSAPHIINFSIPNIKSEVFVHALVDKNIYVSTTSACSSKQNTISDTLLAMGAPKKIASSAIRISLSYQNTEEEIKVVLNAIKETVESLREVMK